MGVALVGVVVPYTDCPSVATVANLSLPEAGVVCEVGVDDGDQRSGVDLCGCLGEVAVEGGGRRKGEEGEERVGREGRGWQERWIVLKMMEMLPLPCVEIRALT